MHYYRQFKHRNKKIKPHFRTDVKKLSLLNKDYRLILNIHNRKNQI